jgi:hypothetical protein
MLLCMLLLWVLLLRPLVPLPLPLPVCRLLRMRRRRPLPYEPAQRHPLLERFLSQERRRHAVGRRGCREELLPPRLVASRTQQRARARGSPAEVRRLDQPNVPCCAFPNTPRASAAPSSPATARCPPPSAFSFVSPSSSPF